MKCAICNEEISPREPILIDGQEICYKEPCISKAVSNVVAPVKEAMKRHIG